MGNTPGRALLFGFWVLPALVATLGFRVVPSRYNPGLSLWGIFASQLLIWQAWGIWSLLIVAMGNRFPLERGRMLRAVAVHLPLSAVVVAAQILVISTVADAFHLTARSAQAAAIDSTGTNTSPTPHQGLDSTLALGLRQYGDLLFVVYFAVVGAHAALRWNRRWREESLRSAQLGEDLAQASLQALRAQLNPHFLFNALNSIVTLIGRDPAAAETMTVRLSELLRATLAAGDVQESTLDQELALTARYLEIEQVRFVDRLSIEWNVADDARRAMVPAFALQPLVENAIRHGIARRAGPGHIGIFARREGDEVVLTTSDDGVGIALSSSSDGVGIALANLRSRLARLHGSAATVTLAARDGGGTNAVVRLPFRTTATSH